MANDRVHELLSAPIDPQWVSDMLACDGSPTANQEGENVDVYVLPPLPQWESSMRFTFAFEARCGLRTP